MSEQANKSILELNKEDAREFLLKAESYSRLDLPSYISFDKLIKDVHRVLDGKELASMSDGNPRDYNDVNYTILDNKDSKFAWRPFQLIHPALYVSLVHKLTEEANWLLIQDRFKEFAANPKIQCLSLPIVSMTEQKDKAEQVTNWWHEVEQRSIELSLDYDYLAETDLTDCYGAIYTHSIAWALHTKPEAKKKENRNNKALLGNIIDNHIQDMRHGQTNGIPQGSVLMDLIAEMVLGLADLELSLKINASGISDYHILRYRDDYRIFVNNPQEGSQIVKLLTEVMIVLNFKLNPSKTKANNDVVRSSIKADKLAWMGRKQNTKSLQKQLLLIHDHATNYPNAGSLLVALNKFYRRIVELDKLRGEVMPLIAIAIDIAYRNPRTYAVVSAILSKVMTFIEVEEEKISIAEKIKTKFSKVPHTGFIQMWMQRVTLPIEHAITYEEPICQLVSGEQVNLWNNDWISGKKLSSALDVSKIVDQKKLEEIKPVIPTEEVELFMNWSS